MKTVRIGGGAGFAGDSIEPALVLLEKGELDYIAFECLAERTIAMAMQQKRQDPNKGYNALLERRMRKVLPLARKNGVKVITNMGAANVEKAVEKVAQIAREQGLTGIKIVGVLGDDVFDRLDGYRDAPVMEFDKRLGEIPNKVAANAYVGCGPIVEALRLGADVVITGRCSDPALFLGPLVHEFGWSMEDFHKMGVGTLVGHLMECSVQVSGGNFALPGPGNKDVERLWEIGYPYADVREDGVIYISKVAGTGGRVDVHTCTEQLLYEIHDPANYITPDCVADFSKVEFEQAGENRVRATGATGKSHTGNYKVSVGYQDGYIGSAGLSYGGAFCLERALLAKETLEKIIAAYYDTQECKIDLMGYNSLMPRDPERAGEDSFREVRVRVAARAKDAETLAGIADEVDTLTISGPANGGGMERSIKELVAACSFLIDRDDIKISYVSQEV